MDEETQRARKCCLCIPRNIGIKLIFLWLFAAMFVIPSEIIRYKVDDAKAMIPIVCIIFGMVTIMTYVFFCKDSAAGRYLLFVYWNVGIMFAWNVYWWFLIFKGFNTTAADWECGLEHTKGTNAYNACLEPKRTELFYATFPPMIIDIYFTWEMWRWMKDGYADEGHFEKQEDDQ